MSPDLNFRNLQEIQNIPEFRDLIAHSILHILKNGKNELKIIDLFSAFTVWVEDKKDLEENEKAEMLRCFELGATSIKKGKNDDIEQKEGRVHVMIFRCVSTSILHKYPPSLPHTLTPSHPPSLTLSSPYNSLTLYDYV